MGRQRSTHKRIKRIIFRDSSTGEVTIYPLKTDGSHSLEMKRAPRTNYRAQGISCSQIKTKTSSNSTCSTSPSEITSMYDLSSPSSPSAPSSPSVPSSPSFCFIDGDDGVQMESSSEHNNSSLLESQDYYPFGKTAITFDSFEPINPSERLDLEGLHDVTSVSLSPYNDYLSLIDTTISDYPNLEQKSTKNNGINIFSD